MTIPSEFFLPELRRYNGAAIKKRDFLGRKKGERVKYKWKTRPYRHQVEAIFKLIETGFGGALLMEPRTGKTKTVIDYASIMHLAGKVERMIIFCPVSVLGVWQDQFEAHCPVPYRITVWDRKARKKHGLPQRKPGILDVIILNYDALSTPGARYTNREGYEVRSKRRGGRFDVFKSLSDWAPHLVALDESHRIKTATAKKTSMVIKLGEIADYRVIMTGTVVTKKKRMHDIWAQWQFLNPERFKMSHAEFKSFYGRFIPMNGYTRWTANQNTSLLHEQIHQDAYAVTRAECFDLPPRVDNQIVYVDLEDSRAAYEDMAQHMLHEIETGEVTQANLVITQTLRLRQIASGVARTDPSDEHPKGRLYRVGQEKLDALEDYLQDLVEQGEKVVIAAQFTADIKAIETICQRLKMKTFMLYGAIKRTDRDANIKAFRATEEPAAFIMQPQAGSLGIDLSTSGTFIWFSLTNSYVDYTQAEDRIALNPRGTRFVYFLARDTVEEAIYDTLQDDGDVARAIMASPRLLLGRRG
jgi:SNF2 family DNA or RNA helicase